MDDGELDVSNQEVFSGSLDDIRSNSSMDSFFNDIFNDTHACTHTHTCNPPGPDASHTHTCYHVHTKLVPASTENKVVSEDTAESAENKSKKRPLGNREAVRKYREKKKARAASLEDEVVRLRALNQHLLKRLQGQGVLEAEIVRLKCLLADIRGRIDGEIGSFPYQKSVNPSVVTTNFSSAYTMNPCSSQCDDQVNCLHPEMEGNGVETTTLNGQGLNGCDFQNLQCSAIPILGQKELPGCGIGSLAPNKNSSDRNKRKGGANPSTAC